MDIGNFERIDREQRQRSSPPELALASAAEDRRVPAQKKNDKLSVIFLLQTLFALFVTAAILLSSGGYLGDTPETLPNDIAEDAATRTLSSLYERWFGGTDASGSSLPESDSGSGAQSEAEPGENSENGSEDQPHTEKLSSGIKYAALYPREITRSGLSGSLRIPATATLAPIATTARAESPITGWDRSTAPIPSPASSTSTPGLTFPRTTARRYALSFPASSPRSAVPTSSATTSSLSTPPAPAPATATVPQSPPPRAPVYAPERR